MNDPPPSSDPAATPLSHALADTSGVPAAQRAQPAAIQVCPAALVAAALALLASLLASFIFALTTPAQLFGDQLTLLIPLPVFERLLALFGPSAKHLFYGVVLLGEGLLTAAAGVAYIRLRGRVAPRLNLHADRKFTLADVIPFALLVWLLSAGILAPLIGGGLFGAALPGGVSVVFLAELIPNVAFGLALQRLLRPRAPRLSTSEQGAAPSPATVSRRRFLRDAAFVGGVVAGGALAWDLISQGLGRILGTSGAAGPDVNLGDVPSKVPPPTPAYTTWPLVSGQTPEVTSANDFYYVSKNLASDPTIDAASWTLDVSGLVQTPFSLTYAQLQALPPIERYHTLECISNDVGGDLMSNARFTGASLADLLDRAGIRPGADSLVFRASDGYSDSLHLAQALDARSLVAYRINGQPLPQAHGYPARLLIPGLYGMKNGKWLTSLTVASGAYDGYWEQQGWTREARVKMTSRIDVPHDGDLLLARPLAIAGVAYAGDRGIGRVDVSTDGGDTYHPATFHPASLRTPLGPLTWVLWRYDWTPPASGRYVLIVRAIDRDGNVQTPAEAPTLPDGASGYHRIAVVVR